MTLLDLQCIASKSDPADKPKGYYPDYQSAIAAWQARQAARATDPWGLAEKA